MALPVFGLTPMTKIKSFVNACRIFVSFCSSFCFGVPFKKKKKRKTEPKTSRALKKIQSARMGKQSAFGQVAIVLSKPYYLAGEIVAGRVDLNLVMPVTASHLAVVRATLKKAAASQQNSNKEGTKIIPRTRKPNKQTNKRSMKPGMKPTRNQRNKQTNKQTN